MPPITASSCLSFATRREVTSKRFITLVLRAFIFELIWPDSLVEHLAAREQRAEDQRDRRLRRDGLLDRAVGDEFELVEPGDGAMVPRQRVEHRPHGKAAQR